MKIPSESGCSFIPMLPLTLRHVDATGAIVDEMYRAGSFKLIGDFLSNPSNYSLFRNPEFDTGGALSALRPELQGISTVLSRHEVAITSLITEQKSLSQRVDVSLARQFEDADGGRNSMFEARVVVHGIETRIATSDADARSSAIVKSVSDVFNRIFGEGHGYEIVSGSYFDAKRPIYEVTLSSVEQSRLCRSSFARRPLPQRKAFGIRLTNSLTPASRVRVSILQVLLVICIHCSTSFAWGQFYFIVLSSISSHYLYVYISGLMILLRESFLFRFDYPLALFNLYIILHVAD